jgi:hypothetical protein
MNMRKQMNNMYEQHVEHEMNTCVIPLFELFLNNIVEQHRKNNIGSSTTT